MCIYIYIYTHESLPPTTPTAAPARATAMGGKTFCFIVMLTMCYGFESNITIIA